MGTRRRTSTLALALVLTLMEAPGLTGCGIGDAPAGTRPSPAASPYALYTHCGIDEANIGGHWYRASDPLSDGSGNPPPGWNNPYQQGTITLVSPGEVVFSDPAGHRVHFVLRPDATGPLQVCS